MVIKGGTDYKRILVIGDIHGEFTKLISLYDKIKVADNDLVIFLGDYVDRGNENVKVLKWVLNESKKDNVIMLCGNHEDMLRTDILSGNVRKGIKGTLGEIALEKEIDRKFEDKLFIFLKKLPYYYRMNIGQQEYYFCHAGIDPEESLDSQYEMDLLWIREKFLVTYEGKAIIVVGHTPVMYLKSEEEIKQMVKAYKNQPENKEKTLVQLVEEMTEGDDDDDEDDADIDIISRKESPFIRSDAEVLKMRKCTPQWRNNGKILMMDTGSFMPNGCISCMDILTGKVWQSD